MNYNFAELNAKEMNETNGGYVYIPFYPAGYPYVQQLGVRVALGILQALGK